MITPAFPLTATERVLPKLALDFTTASLDPRVTFTRALNTATRVNSSGVIEGVNADIPRFDFDPVTLACRGLLVEEARTNLMLYSSAYNTGVANMWGPSNITFTTGQLAPDGTNTALQCRQDNNTSAVIASGIANEPTITSGATVTYTQYFKYTNARWLLLQLSPPSGSASASRLRGWFDLQNGVAGSVSNVSPATGCTISIEPAPKGYYRCTITGALNDSLTKARPLWIAVNGDGSVTRAPTNSSYIAYGSQWENATFPTSYIPTEATALTRNADVATMTGTNFSDWFNASEGAAVFQFSRPNMPATGAAVIGSFNNGASTNRLQFNLDATPARGGEFFIVSGGSTQADLRDDTILVADTTYRLAGSYKLNNFRAYRNGAVFTPDTSGSVPVGCDTLTIGRNHASGAFFNGYIEKVSYWPFQITNPELQAFSK